MLLSTHMGTLLLCGRRCISRKWPFVHKFEALPADDVENIVSAWHCSPLRPKSQLARLMRALVMSTLVNQAGMLSGIDRSFEPDTFAMS